MYFNEELYKESFYHSNIYHQYFGDLNIGIIDIETTGLQPLQNQLILGGLVIPREDGKSAIQFFSDSLEEEKIILEQYLSSMKDLDVLIHFNGDNFDLPFLGKRIQHHQIPYDTLPNFFSFDLYRILNKFSGLRKILPNLKQKTVETYLGLWSDRSDEISGAESVELYFHYLRTKDQKTRDTILLHNKDDILQLSRLMKVLDKLDLHKIMYHIGFMVKEKEKKMIIQKNQFQKNYLNVIGKCSQITLDYHCFDASYEATIREKSKDFVIKVPLQQAHGYSFVDLSAFPFDCTPLEKYPGYASDYMIIKGDADINYAETNLFIRFLIKHIVSLMQEAEPDYR